jgi:transcriptional regulator with GAF, ATPase, and Fis domain
MDQGRFPRLSDLSWEQEVHRALHDKNIFMKGVAYRHRAVLEKQKGQPPQKIIGSLHLSLKLLEESGHQIEIAKSKFELARQYLLRGDEGRAKKVACAASKILSFSNDALIPDDLRFLTKDQTRSEDVANEVLRLGRELATARSNKDLLEGILTSANRLLGAERAGLFLLSDEDNPAAFRLEASRNLSLEVIDQPTFRPSIQMIEEAAHTKEGRISDAVLSEHVSSYAIRSSICTPVIRGAKAIAVLYHDNLLVPTSFKESDLAFLNFFGALTKLALDHKRATDDVQELNSKLKENYKFAESSSSVDVQEVGIVGTSSAIRYVIAKAKQIANTESNVLISGETGVGKEVVARAIHNMGERHNKPFVHIVCSALQETLITSELFGHEKGAFTGAATRRKGRIELANGGTLFLDEVGDLSPAVQVRLLRVLQNKEFERVGGNETLYSNFRLIAATNRDLTTEVTATRFREDLYYRLNVFPISIPPLRERKEDIPVLAQYFLQKHCRKLRKHFAGIDEKARHRLIQYDWPGNVRELENVIEKSVILSSEPVLQISKIDVGRKEILDSTGRLTLRENERVHIIWALQKTGGKVRGPGGAAELLDIHPSTLEFRIKKLGIERAQIKKAKMKVSTNSAA